MDLQRYNALLLEMDERVMSGAPMTPEAHRLLAALRMLTNEVGAGHRKMADRVNAMKAQVDGLREREAQLEKSLNEEARSVTVSRRQMGIWRAKAKRLEAAA
jgi:uncharacterized NAD(P)/FAD-binding protein YdhS|tara:strand:- start:137 stop:442 length:306 start_codon:yes stop_codon:yes gene_type:complete